MTLAIVNSATYAGGTQSTTHSVTLPSSIVSGNLLVMFARAAAETTETGDAGVPVITGWTSVASREISGNVGASSVLVRQADGTEGSTVTATINNDRRFVAITYQISGHNGTANVTAAVSDSAFGSGNTVDPPEVTATWGSDENLFFAFVSYDQTTESVTAAPTNYSGLVAIGNGVSPGSNRCYCATAHRALTAASDNAGEFTITGTSYSSPHAYGFVIQPSAGVTYTLDLEPLYYGGNLLANKTGIEFVIESDHVLGGGTTEATGTSGTTNASGVFQVPGGYTSSTADDVTLSIYWEEGNPAVDRSLIVKTTLVAPA